MLLLQVGDFTCNLSQEELEHYTSCRILVERVNVEDFRPKDRIRLSGLSLPLTRTFKYKKGRTFGTYDKHNEIIINKRVLRVELNQDTRRRVFFTPKELAKLELSGSADNNTATPKRKSILKRKKRAVPSRKSVSFDEVVYITPISPIKHQESASEDETPFNPYVNGNLFVDDFDDDSDDLLYNPYLDDRSNSAANGTNSNFFGESSSSGSSYNPEVNGECSYSSSSTSQNYNPHINGECSYSNSRTLNGACLISEGNSDNIPDIAQSITNNMDAGGFPKRKRGRPKKINPDPPFTPSTANKRPYPVVQKKIANQSPVTDSGEPRRKRGRPRKKVEFGFHSIVSEIKTILLPSDLWSAHVSVTSKRSQVCFTRIVQPVSDNIPVECDRSVKFNGSNSYSVKINNRSVELIAAPKTVNSLNDIEILLQIVHDIDINDPVLRYLPR